MPLIQKILDKLHSYFQTQKDIHTVILYGSAVSGIFSDTSDVDIAAAANTLLPPDRRVELHQDLERILDRRVDLRDLSSLNGIILYQVLHKGSVIKDETPAYLEQKTREMIDFRQDMYPILEQGMMRSLSEFADGR